MKNQNTLYMICSDMEGIFTPEIWINVAEKTGIPELRLTTRDVPDYDVLMKGRLALLHQHKITLKEIQKVIATLSPLQGSLELLNWLRSRYPTIIVSDTYIEFAGPLLEKLGWPTLFCHSLITNSDGMIHDYKLRQIDGKRMTVISLKNLNYKVIGIGDSYNDISMLKESNAAILFRPPDAVKQEYSQFPVAYSYDELKTHILNITDHRI
ncbi:MAG: bifunctional phosphoserine phosphatase/homoserine phosphotransferase ThrH [Thermodesulfobacteriota bacterium]